MGKPSAPPAPDYAAAATAQGQANLQAGQQQSLLNNPNINAPGYSISYQSSPGHDNTQQISALQKEMDGLRARSPTGAAGRMFAGSPIMGSGRIKEIQAEIDRLTNQSQPGRSTQNITLSPDQQRIFDLNNQSQGNLSQIGLDATSRVGDLLKTPFDASSIDRNKMAQTLIDRDQPMMDRARDRRETQLSNQGIMLGSNAYSSAQDDLSRGENDFRLGAYDQAGNEMQREFGLQTAMRQMPINEINALRSGTQLQMPSPGVNQSSVQPSPIFDGMMAQNQNAMSNYNAQMAQRGNFMNGLFGLGGAYLMGGM